MNLNRLNYDNLSSSYNLEEELVNNFNSRIYDNYKSPFNTDFRMFLKFPHLINILGAENDSKQHSNNFKFLLNNKYKKKSINNFDFLLNNTFNNTLTIDPTTTFSSSVYNTESNLKFKDYKSSNAQFLGSERTPRLLNNLNSSAYK
jgi:hypothetical protein